MTLYGIPNCDTVKKASTWLKEKGIDFTFHNYKKDGISTEKLQNWLNQTTWETLINKAGSTWKQTPDHEKATDAASALVLMQTRPSVIKRPLITDTSGRIVALGFKPEVFEQVFK